MKFNVSRSIVLLVFSFSFCQPLLAEGNKEHLNLQHGVNYKQPKDISHYWISEKLDGVRGFWDGKNLLTRSGNKITAPKWFISNWPETAIDGELWIDRGKFQLTVSCVRRKNANKCWRKVRFRIFDLPDNKGSFTQRIKTMRELTLSAKNPYLAMIPQFRLTTIKGLNAYLTKVIKLNGEGLMLHHEDAYYHPGRNSALMKLKMHQDAEAIVIEHIQGKGKYKTMLGAIRVRTPEGLVFKIGSGFTDQQRKIPPAIGAVITYKFIGKTQKGVPRFASFLRTRSASL